MGVAAAVAGASAVAGIGGSLISSGAAKSAANTQAQAADLSAQEQQQQFAQTEKNLLPYMSSGIQGNIELLNALGVNTGQGNNLLALNGINGLTYKTPSEYSSVLANPTFSPTQAQLEATPGYQFDLTQGLQSVQNSNAAQGLGISGAAMKGAANYATGLANNTLQTQAAIFQNNYANAMQGNQLGQSIFQSNLGNVLNPLMYLTNLGQNSAANVGQTGMQSVANIGATQIGGANALASGTVGSANALSGALAGVGNAPLNYMMYSQLMNGGMGGGGGMVDSGQFD